MDIDSYNLAYNIAKANDPNVFGPRSTRLAPLVTHGELPQHRIRGRHIPYQTAGIHPTFNQEWYGDFQFGRHSSASGRTRLGTGAAQGLTLGESIMKFVQYKADRRAQKVAQEKAQAAGIPPPPGAKDGPLAPPSPPAPALPPLEPPRIPYTPPSYLPPVPVKRLAPPLPPTPLANWPAPHTPETTTINASYVEDTLDTMNTPITPSYTPGKFSPQRRGVYPRTPIIPKEDEPTITPSPTASPLGEALRGPRLPRQRTYPRQS